VAGAIEKDHEDHVERLEADLRTAMRRLEPLQIRRNLFGREAASR